MKIIDVYSGFIEEFKKAGHFTPTMKENPNYSRLFEMARDWEIDLSNVENWLKSPEYKVHKQLAENFLGKALLVLEKVESILGTKLVGQINLSPSFMQFDGFARYDSGAHTVWFGVDHPDADENYLKVLMAHELSHVYRDHQPQVWASELGKLGKTLQNFSREDYLECLTADEHLVSEGLATLFSQMVYPEVDLHVHHYYLPQELSWCLENKDAIEKAILNCMSTDQNVWKFYGDDVVAPGSPSRTQYFWAALKIREWLTAMGPDYGAKLIEFHGRAAQDFKCFKPI